MSQPPGTAMLLKAELSQLKRELKEEDRLRSRLSNILTDTAEALHGGALRGGMWSWHDLADLAEEQRKLLTAAYHCLRSYQNGNGSADLAEEIADACQQLLERDADRTTPVE